MPTPSEVLSTHTQQSNQSCAASGIEVILKCHGKLALNDFTLQQQYGDENIGFEKVDELLSRGIIPTNKVSDFAQAAAEVASEVKDGRFPLVSLPVHREGNKVWFHIYVAGEDAGQIQLLDPASAAPVVSGNNDDVSAFMQARMNALGLPFHEVNYLIYQVEK